MAADSVADSTSTRVVTYWAATRRSLSCRARSARASERAVIAMSAANMNMVSTTTMARPTSGLKSPARSLRTRSQPSAAGTRSAAGKTRRARTPPAWSPAITDTTPRSGRAQRMPAPSTRKPNTVEQRDGLVLADGVEGLHAIHVAQERDGGDPHREEGDELLGRAPRPCRRARGAIARRRSARARARCRARCGCRRVGRGTGADPRRGPGRRRSRPA